MTTLIPMICNSCLHRDLDGYHCAAYPDSGDDAEGITLDAMKAETHFEVRPDQNNDIVYLLDPDKIEEAEDFAQFAEALGVANGA